MKVNSISIKGWRSFDKDGIKLTSLSRINIVIGQNNCGKSNISKLFSRIKNNRQGFSSQDFDSYNKILDYKDTWAWSEGKVEFSISISEKIKDINEEADFELQGEIATNKEKLSTDFFDRSEPSDTTTGKLVVMHKNSKISYGNNYLPMSNKKGKLIITGGDYHEPLNAMHQRGNAYGRPYTNEIVNELRKNFIERMVFVHPLRNYSPMEKTKADSFGNVSSTEDKEYKHHDFNGENVLVDVHSLYENKYKSKDWREYKEKISQWISTLLDEKVDDFEVGKYWVRISLLRGGSKCSFYLDELGTGVAQAFMLLTHLYLSELPELMVFIDEPESNLHPSAVVKLVRILNQDFRAHQFIITTHSSPLIDAIEDGWNIYRMYKAESGASRIVHCSRIVEYYSLLDDLGVRASQILQSNCVIWVEGPSDRIYVKKWIELISGNKYTEGKDYSFLFYGGSNLAQFSLGDDALVNMLSTSRRAYLISDSDCDDVSKFEDKNFKSYVKNFEAQVLEKMQVEGDGFNKYFCNWITNCREIENYAPDHILKEVLFDDERKKNYFGRGAGSKKAIKLINQQEFCLKQFDSYDDIATRFYAHENDDSLNENEIKNLKSHYSSQKVKIAHAITEKLTIEDINERYGLKEQVENLVDFISAGSLF